VNVKRIATAAVFLPLFVLYVMKLPSPFFTTLVAAVSALAIVEFYSMYGIRGPLKYLGIAAAVAMPAALHAGLLADMLLAFVLLATGARLFTRPTPSSSLAELAPVILGVLYIPGLLSVQVHLREEAPGLILLLYGTVWCADSFAYYIGKGLGKRQLYEAMSPKKTVAGAVGSVAGGAVGAVSITLLILPEIPYPAAALTGLLVGAVTIIGDLVESMFKRDAGVKDSGAIIPGHGGILDKIDGSLFAGPVLFWLLIALGVIARQHP
jgi:phosphatidate cytidylyltransferase